MISILALFQGQLPFAVVGSMDEVKVGNKMVKARQYPWGVVQGKGERAGRMCAETKEVPRMRSFSAACLGSHPLSEGLARFCFNPLH